MRFILCTIFICFIILALIIFLITKKTKKSDFTFSPTPLPCSNISCYWNPSLFPILNNLQELNNSDWYYYIDAVYGIDTINNHFPIEINKFSFFYTKYLPTSVQQKMQPKSTPYLLGDFYSSLNTCFEYCDTVHVYLYPGTLSYNPTTNRPYNPILIFEWYKRSYMDRSHSLLL